ncbi:hypothetical protein ISN44_As02g031200 [Arabidopsis suecica]|uniref:Uncharacterized protein n=1 Tax=Arabidopsis suecica TaxID=45249 RepID=A0A8T2G992_ARASU|nr:hypothetical protein ISN44_As02g031200 [Arabidopsis suecica]
MDMDLNGCLACLDGFTTPALSRLAQSSLNLLDDVAAVGSGISELLIGDIIRGGGMEDESFCQNLFFFFFCVSERESVRIL